MSISYNFKDFHSEFICTECGGLLYVNDKTEREICIRNQNCSGFPKDLVFTPVTPDKEPQLFNEIRQSIAALLLDIYKKCDHRSLASYIYRRRKDLIDSMFENGVLLPISDLLALNEFLIVLNNSKPLGNNSIYTFFKVLFERFKEAIERLDFIEDIQNFRYLLIAPPDVEVFKLKYLEPINDMYKSYGIGRSSKASLLDMYSFLEIQELATGDKSKTSTDLADHLEDLWLLTQGTRYIFSMHYRTSKQYLYNLNSTDMAVLVSIFMSLRNDQIVSIPLANLEKHFNAQLQIIETIRPDLKQPIKSFSEFLKEYAESTDKVPIMVKVGDSVMIDRHTLLFFILYLFSQDTSTDTASISSGNQRILRKKEKTGEYFEQKIREIMSSYGYKGPDKPIIDKYEYDILKLSESKKRIIIADAKFRDISPSSISGRTLVEQELLQENQGLIPEADKQASRLDHFINYKENFRSYLNPEADWTEYAIHAYLITKHIPLIDQYKQIKVIAYSRFITTEL